MQRTLIGQLTGLAPRERCALVVSGSPRRTSPALVSQLARRVDFILAVDSGAELVRAAGLAPDVLLGDFDSIDPQTRAYYQANAIETLAFDPYKDATDIELALEAVRQRGYSTIIATSALGGRVDHELATLGALAALSEQGMRVCVVEDVESCVFLSADDMRSGAVDGRHDGAGDGASGRGAPCGLELVGLAATMPSFVSLIPWGGDATVTIRGAEWELDHETLEISSSRGVSNVPTSDRVGIEVHNGTAFVVLQVCALKGS
jgi:thiamine pyrophosphokinase